MRLLPGGLGNDDSSVDESFSDGLLEYPQYTQPAEFEGRRFPRSCARATTPASRVAPGQALRRTLRVVPTSSRARGGLSAGRARFSPNFQNG